MSKQPLVKPMRSPCRRQSARCASRSPPAGTIFSSAASDACGRIFRRSSAGVTVAVPFLPTATAAAAFAIRSAVSQSAPAASVSASTAATVSPAPETSRTLTGSAGTWIASPPRTTSVMPCSLCVTSMASQSARTIASCAAAAMFRSVSARLRVASANSLRLGVSSVAPR